MCVAPNGNQQLECYCTTSTCGAGMLDVRAAVLAVPAPSATQALAFATPAAPAPGDTVTLDGSTSVPASGKTIAGYQWTLLSGSNFATLGATTTAPTVTVATNGGGTFTVQLDVTDSAAATVSTTLVVTVAAPTVTPPASSGGGGTMSWPWLLGLGVAVAALRPRRRA
jgi:serine protease